METPTEMVMVDLGIPPGFTADAAPWTQLDTEGKVKKYIV